MYIKKLKLISILLIMMSMLLILVKIVNPAKILENKYINNSFTNKDDISVKYKYVLEIPKLNLKKGIYEETSKYNNVENGILIHNLSNSTNNLFILASHSGNSRVSNFNSLDKLLPKDIAYIKTKDRKIKYYLKRIEIQEKRGELNIKLSSNSLVLITCSKKDKTKQFIYYFKMKEEKNKKV